MENSFWQERWRENQIAFHQGNINQHLQHYATELGLSLGEQVLVPLCGKSLDMLWLNQQGYSVCGVELSPIAAESFFRENNLPFEEDVDGKLVRLRSGAITILQGDIFDLTSSQTKDIRAVYDRAALIAFPREMRARYAEHIAGLVPAGTRLLLIAIDYPQHLVPGPPFSVSEKEIQGLYNGAFDVELVSSKEVDAGNTRFTQHGIASIVEQVYLMNRR